MAKILIIEDEALLRGSLTAEFKRAGFDVSEAKDGWEGLQMARREHPDILLLDIILPKIQGLDVLKLLRGDPWGKTVPVVVLTSLGDGDTASQAAVFGVYSILVKKDWTPEEVVEKVREKLSSKK